MAISYDSQEVLDRFAKQRAITYPLLADPGSKTIEAFGILNREAGGKAKGVPHPGTFIVDKQGVIIARLFHEGYKERHLATEMIKATRAAAKPK